MSFWKSIISVFGNTAKDVFVVGTLNGLVLETKAAIDKQIALTKAERDFAKVGVDLLAERVRNSIS